MPAYLSMATLSGQGVLAWLFIVSSAMPAVQAKNKPGGDGSSLTHQDDFAASCWERKGPDRKGVGSRHRGEPLAVTHNLADSHQRSPALVLPRKSYSGCLELSKSPARSLMLNSDAPRLE